MAQARMLNRSVAEDEALAGLSAEAALLFLMTIPHLDRDGLITGHPRLLWSDVAPLRDGLRECAGTLIDEWVQANLVVRFGDGRPVLFFPGFQKNQSGMRYDRESPSKYPTPPGYERTSDGLTLLGEALRNGSVAGGVGEGVGSNSGSDPATLPTNSGVAPASGRNGAGTAPATVRSRAAARAAAEVQDQAQDQDQVQVQVQSQVQVESDVDDDREISSSLFVGVGKNACVREQNFAEAEVGEDGRIHLTEVGVARQKIREGHGFSIGDLMFVFPVKQARRAGYELGATLNLHMEWSNFRAWLEQQEELKLWQFLEWCQFYSELPPAAMKKIASLTGIIRSHLQKDEEAPLTGAQRARLALTVERVEEIAAQGIGVAPVADEECPF